MPAHWGGHFFLPNGQASLLQKSLLLYNKKKQKFFRIKGAKPQNISYNKPISNKKEDAIGIQWSKNMFEKLLIILVLSIVLPIKFVWFIISVVLLSVLSIIIVPVAVLFGDPRKKSRRK